MDALPALQIDKPVIDPVKQFQDARTQRIQDASETQRQQVVMMEVLANGAAYAMPDGPKGEADPERWQEVTTSFKAMGFDPAMIDKISDPRMVGPILHGSAAALSASYDAQLFPLKVKEMQAGLDQTAAELARKPAPTIETMTDPKTGQNQRMQWNAKDGVWEPFGGQSATASTEDETWFGNQIFFRDPETKKVIAGQLSNHGRFRPAEGTEGLEPALPVNYLNTETSFVPVDKLGQTPEGTPPVPINNTQGAFDTGVGGEMAKQLAAKRDAALDAQLAMAANAEARKLLDEGVITGFAADFKVGLGKALQSVGISFAPDAIANSEAFVASRAQEVGRLIKLFGAGTGLSDADREYAEKAAAGQIELTEAAIRRILDMLDRAGRAVINSYNSMATETEEKGRPSLTVDIPSDDGIDDEDLVLPDPLGARQ